MFKSHLIYLTDIVNFLNNFFNVEQFPTSERGGIYLPSLNPVERLGLALEAKTGLYEWVRYQSLDILFLHRPWNLELKKVPAQLGIISYHLPFDENLTVGFNPRLAQVLQMSNLEVLGKKENRAIGMIGNIQTQSFLELCSFITQTFGKPEQVLPSVNSDIKRIAVVGAMTDLLVREAAKRGGDVYITGQFRQPAKAAIQETQISVITVGHRRSELWGLRSLSEVLQERWSRLEVFIYNDSEST
ncbi:NGG1p interacting factor NIF3 [Tolypothrix sp. PCC 7910]|uniref:Nif3-like dinuclear metal center hexameric protein n=1 Tax=Tolypothrix sp. PCC 7910 TaxID=2099387 RepID=UPI0014276F00|nr:Nif3-like dinuclear metal center hexameric protein [Tolypothrix sp. PCC 7910]QIR35813.1 NGG1p interacting factor NIF3 [Tolypothrix sp. PCC 7910]